MKSDLIIRAVAFATSKHANQFRTGGEAFVNHPRRVATLLQEIGILDEEIIAAAWLHDTIEDTQTSFEELEVNFGKRVATIVQELTQDYPDEGLNPTEKNQKTKAYAERMSIDAKIIKYADRYDNICDAKEWSAGRIKRYWANSHHLINGLGEIKAVETIRNLLLNKLQEIADIYQL